MARTAGHQGRVGRYLLLKVLLLGNAVPQGAVEVVIKLNVGPIQLAQDLVPVRDEKVQLCHAAEAEQASRRACSTRVPARRLPFLHHLGILFWVGLIQRHLEADVDDILHFPAKAAASHAGHRSAATCQRPKYNKEK